MGYYKQLFIVACVNVGQFMDGYWMGWAAPVIPKLQDVNQTPLPYPMTDMDISLFGSAIYICVFTTPFVLHYVSNHFGRKPCLLLAGLINLIISVLIVTTKNMAMLFSIRCLCGFAVLLITISNLVYIGEIASTNIRGMLLSSTSIVGILGTLAAYSIGPYVSYTMTGYIAAVGSILYIIGLLYIPESPVYYALKGKETEAKNVLRRLGRLDDLENVFNLVKATGSEKVSKWTILIKLFTVKANRTSLFITFTLYALQQFSGIMVVLVYSTKIFQFAGSSIKPELATILIGLMRLIASFIAPLLVERLGRKILLQISTAFCALSLTIFGIFFLLVRLESPIVEKIGWLPLIVLAMYLGSYEIGFGNIPGALLGEMFAGDARSTGSAVAVNSGFFVGFMVSFGFGAMINNLGGDITFGLYALSCVIAFLFTCKFVPETKGKALCEIQSILNKL